MPLPRQSTANRQQHKSAPHPRIPEPARATLSRNNQRSSTSDMNRPYIYTVKKDSCQRFGNELADVAIIFNNKRPITYLKKHLADVYGKAIWSPQFFTIQEFFKQAADATEASPLTQFFYLFQLHNELLAAEGSEP